MEKDKTPAPVSHLVGTKRLLAHVASIICEETCGLTSQCKSREAAKALFDKGYLKSPTSAPIVAGSRVQLYDGTTGYIAHVEYAVAVDIDGKPAPETGCTPILVCKEDDFVALPSPSTREKDP